MLSPSASKTTLWYCSIGRDSPAELNIVVPLSRYANAFHPLGSDCVDVSARLHGEIEEPDGRVGEFLEAFCPVGGAADDFYVDFSVVCSHGGISPARKSRYRGSQLFNSLGRSTHNCMPTFGDPSFPANWHLSVHDPPASGHELQIALVNRPLVSRKVLVVHGSLKQVRDCFLAPVRVVWEPGAGCDAEVVEHEEGGEVS